MDLTGKRGPAAATWAAAAMAVVLGIAWPAWAGGEQPPGPREATEEEILEYYESGRYAEDTEAVARSARRSLRRQLDGGLSDGDDAIVFDIDDTALSSYECQKRHGDFGSTELALCVIVAGAQTTTGTGDGLPAIEPVRRLYRLAQRKAVSIFFITGRPELARPSSIDNLRAAGFDGPFELIMQRNVQFTDNTLNENSLVPYKSGARAKIERRGYQILVNIGDQRSDLQGGHAAKRFKVPNPMYFTP
jgi:hypothetical protein